MPVASDSNTPQPRIATMKKVLINACGIDPDRLSERRAHSAMNSASRPPTKTTRHPTMMPWPKSPFRNTPDKTARKIVIGANRFIYSRRLGNSPQRGGWRLRKARRRGLPYHPWNRVRDGFRACWTELPNATSCKERPAQVRSSHRGQTDFVKGLSVQVPHFQLQFFPVRFPFDPCGLLRLRPAAGQLSVGKIGIRR